MLGTWEAAFATALELLGEVVLLLPFALDFAEGRGEVVRGGGGLGVRGRAGGCPWRRVPVTRGIPEGEPERPLFVVLQETFSCCVLIAGSRREFNLLNEVCPQ